MTEVLAQRVVVADLNDEPRGFRLLVDAISVKLQPRTPNPLPFLGVVAGILGNIAIDLVAGRRSSGTGA